MTLDIVSHVLDISEKLKEVSRFIAEKIRELSGARTVALVRFSGDQNGQPDWELLAMNPARRKKIAESGRFGDLLNYSKELRYATLIQPGDRGSKPGTLLTEIGCGPTLVLPLISGSTLLGIVFAFDTPVDSHTDSVTNMLNTLAGITALILRNSFLIEDQEHAIQERTKKLGERERYFRSLIHSMREDILVIDRDYRICDVNRPTLIATGHESLIGSYCYKSMHGADQPCSGEHEKCMLKHVFDTGEPASCQHVHERTDGSKANVNILLSPLKDENGRVTHVIEGIRDVTELFRAQAAVMGSQELLSRAEDIAQTGCFDWNLRTGLVTWSEGMFALTGITREDFRGNPEDILGTAHPMDGEKLRQAMKRVLQIGKGEDQIEYRLLRPDGSARHISVSVTAINNAEGNPARIVGTAQDITERKTAEGALRDSEVRYRTMVENLPLGVYRSTPGRHGRFIMANSALARMLGFDRVGDLLKIPPSALYADPERRNEMSNKLLAEGKFTGEELLKKKNGELFWGLITTNAVTDESGKKLYFNGIVEDISERKKVEEMLRFNGTRLGALMKLNQMTDEPLQKVTEFALEEGVRLTDSRIGFLAFVNEDETEVTVHNWSETAMDECAVRGKPLVFPIETAGLWGEPIRRRKPIIINDYSLPNPKKKGYPEGHVHIERYMSIPVFDDMRIVAVAGVGNKDGLYDEQDVHQLTLLIEGMWGIIQRRDAQRELERLGTALEQTNEIIVITDADGGIEYVNPAFVKITGYSREEAKGRNMDILDSGENNKDVFGDLWATIKSGDAWTGRLVNRRKDGSDYQQELVISPVKDGSGNVTNYLGVARDVTDKARMELQLRQAQKMEAVGQLAGGIAHDFNNLLQVILGYTNMAQLDLQEDASALADLEEVAKAANRATTLVQQLLTFSRQTKLKPEVLDINDSITDLTKMLRRVIGEHMELTIHSGPNLRPIYGDPGQIGQILMNLCVNARDAMPGGGAITVTTSSRTVDGETRRQHPWMREGDYILLSVSDTGMGIPKGLQERIFEPFFTTKDMGVGTGLGLATVYAIVKRHDGFIHVKSERGKGTEFLIYLPVTKVKSVSRASSMTGAEATGGTETILLAEDDEQVSDLSKAVLENAGYRVLSTGDGEQAIAIFNDRADIIDMAVMDAVMPKKSGIAVYQVIRARKPLLPILFCSGYSHNMLEELHLPKAEINLLKKPFTTADLLSKVRGLLDAGKAE